jgi:hypothetical protein
MLVYYYWNEGNPQAVAFEAPDKAAGYVIEQIEGYIGLRKKNPYKSVKKTKQTSEPGLINWVAQVRENPPAQPIYGGGGGGGDFRFQPVNYVFVGEGGGGGGGIAQMPAPIPNPFDQPVPPIPLPNQQPMAIIPPALDPNDMMEMLDASLKKEKKAKRKSNIDDSPEFIALKEHLQVANENKTLENALKAIDLYDEYAKSVLGIEVVLHTLKDIKVENANI